MSDEEKKLEEYKNNEKFKETINELENIVKNAGFKGLFITTEKDVLGVGGHRTYSFTSTSSEESAQKVGVYERPKDKVWFSENVLENIRELFIADKEFAKETIINIITHEKNHLLGPAGKLMDKEDKEAEKEITNLETNDAQIAMEKLGEINKKYYPYEEKQTELQRINKYYKNLDNFIETEAKHSLTIYVIYNGFDSLKKVNFGPSNTKLTYIFDLLAKKVYKEIDKEDAETEPYKSDELVYVHNNIHDPANKKVDKEYTEIEIHKKIIERMEEMRKELVKKYEEHKGGVEIIK